MLQGLHLLQCPLSAWKVKLERNLMNVNSMLDFCLLCSPLSTSNSSHWRGALRIQTRCLGLCLLQYLLMASENSLWRNPVNVSHVCIEDGATAGWGNGWHSPITWFQGKGEDPVCMGRTFLLKDSMATGVPHMLNFSGAHKMIQMAWKSGHHGERLWCMSLHSSLCHVSQMWHVLLFFNITAFFFGTCSFCTAGFSQAHLPNVFLK